MAIADLLKQVLFDQDRARANSLASEHAEQFRQLLLSPEGDSVRFTLQEDELLRQHPDRLGDLYENLYPEQALQEDPGTTAADIARFERDQATELAEAFESMVLCLPDELTNWDRHFADPGLSEAQVSHLLRKPVMREAGRAAVSLARFGLTPEVFAETFGGFSLLFEQTGDGDLEPQRGDQIRLELLSGNREIPVAMEDLVAQTSETPGLPETGGLADQLTRWSLSALEVLPLLVPGYRLSVREGRIPLVEPAPVGDIGLGARWTRRAQEPRAGLRPQFRL